MNSNQNVIPMNRRDRESLGRMTGGRGDAFRTVKAEDEFRARYAAAMAKLAR